MAQIDCKPVSLIAAADLSAKLYRFGKQTPTGFNVCTVAGERSDGVIAGHQVKNPAVGDAIDVYLDRVFKVTLGGTVTAADSLTTDASGFAITASGGQCVNGIALDSGNSGATIRAFRPMGLALPASPGGVSTFTSGNLSAGVRLAKLSVTNTVAFTLPDGTSAGQEIAIECTAVSGTPVGTLTITTPFSGESATYVFHALGQRVVFVWDGTAWKLVSKRRAGTLAVTVGTTVLTGYLLTETYSLSVTGTVHSLTTMGIPAPQVTGEYIRVVTATAAGSPVGDIAIAGFTKALVAATSLAGINATTCTATYLSNGVSWDNSQVTTATYS